MSPRKPLQDKEILAMIARFEEMRDEGKIPYLDAEQYEDIIEYHIYNKDFPKATEAVEMGLQIHPDEPRLIATRIALYIDEEKIKEARQSINKVLDNNSFPIRLIHTELLVVEGKEEEAKSIIDSFNEDETDEIDCLDIGILCCDIGFHDKALHWLKKCLSFNPENEDALSTICDCYQSMGQYHETIDIFNQLIDKDPYSAEYWTGLGKSYFYLGQFDKAIEACDFALVSDENTGEAYTTKGHACYQLENFEEALKAYKEAWRLENMEIDYASMFIAFCYIGLEEWENAYKHIQEAIEQTDETSPVYPDLLVNSGRCLFHMDRRDEAHNILDFAAECFPEQVLAHIYNGSYYLKEGDRGKAISYFNKAVEINPSTETWNQIFIWTINYEDYKLAKQALEHIKEIDPDFENLSQNMIYVTTKIASEKTLMLSRKKFKEYIRNIVSLGMERPSPYNIESYILRAQEEGKSEDEINDIILALEQINDILENYDIDQEEDEIDDSDIEIEGVE